jgi:NAD-dependent dihydropyrimidine dehydrogenase PreA subunit
MSLKYLRNVSSLKLDTERCTGCGMCLEVCPHAVFVMNGRKAEIKDLDACMECGACARNCSFGALSVQAGVGCAAAVLASLRKGGQPVCGCGTDSCCAGPSCSSD